MNMKLMLALAAALAASASHSMAETQFLYRHTNSSGSFVQNQENAFSVEVVNKAPMFIPALVESDIWRSKLVVHNLGTSDPVTFSVEESSDLQLVIYEDTLYALSSKSGRFGPFMVTATAGDKIATTSFSLDIYSNVEVEKPDDIRALEGQEIDGAIVAKEGMTPYRYAFTEAANVPSTLKLDGATGKLSGTAQAGSYQVQITVTDANSRTAQTTLNLTVEKAEHWQSTVAQSSPTGIRAIPLVSQNTVLTTTNGGAGSYFATIMDSSGGIYSQKTMSDPLPLLKRAGNSSLYMAGGQHIVKLDDLGNVMWKKNVRAGASGNISFSSIDAAPNGDLIALGRAGTPYYLAKLNSMGNVVWVKTLSLSFSNSAVSFGGDGRIYVIVNNSVLIFDAGGNLETSFVLNKPLSQPLSVASDASGGVIVSANTNVFKISPNGTIAWSKVFGSFYNEILNGINGKIYAWFYNADGTSGYGVLNSGGSVTNAGMLTNPSIMTIRDVFKDVHGDDLVVGNNASGNNVVLKFDPATLDHDKIKWASTSYVGANDSSLIATAASYGVSNYAGATTPTSTISITEGAASGTTVEALR